MKNNKTINYIVIIVFVFMLYVPSFLYFVLKDHISTENFENRVLANRPDFQIDKIDSFPQLWEAYYNDHIPFRNNIVNNWRNMNYVLFSESIDDRVIIGRDVNKDTWLFYNNVGDGDEISNIDGRKTINYNDVDSIINNIKDETYKLKNLGISIYYVIAPNKSTVYSDNLPKQIKVKENYFFKVYDYIKNKGINNMFYSIDILKNAGKNYETYYRTDTHWNEYGSYIYSKELLKSIYNSDILENTNIKSDFIELSISDLPDYVKTVSNENFDYNNLLIDNGNTRDLQRFTGISLKIKDNFVNVNYSSDIAKSLVKEKYGATVVYDNKNYKLNEVVLVVGDSFSPAVARHLSSIYKRVVHLQLNHSNYNEEILKKYNFSKVFYVRVERSTLYSLTQKFIQNING